MIGKLETAILLAICSANATELDIRVYDLTGTSAAAVSEAGEVAGALLRPARIDLRWRLMADAPEAHSMVYEVALERRPAPCLMQRGIVVRIATAAPPGLPRGALAFSLPRAVSGANITVFHDRVSETALQVQEPFADFLAYVIAHEIGHVLLGSSAHASGGLMAHRWGDREYELMKRRLLVFDKDNIARFRERLSQEDCVDRQLRASRARE